MMPTIDSSAKYLAFISFSSTCKIRCLPRVGLEATYVDRGLRDLYDSSLVVGFEVDDRAIGEVMSYEDVVTLDVEPAQALMYKFALALVQDVLHERGLAVVRSIQ